MKIPAKIILSRLPIDYSIFRKFSMFVHGKMDDPGYAYKVSKMHYEYAKPWLSKDFTTLELGPGDSLLSALTMTAFGAKKCYLVDVDKFINTDIKAYHNAYQYLTDKGYKLTDFDQNAATVEDFFGNSNMEYLTNGLKSLRQIPDESIDLIWSHAVLEHVRLGEFDQVMKEFNRILKPGGVCSHVVDLKDHFEKSLNNLRFREKTWESDLFAHSGFYTNRIRHDEMINSFEQAGFYIHSDKKYTWENLPIPQQKFTTPYSGYAADNLKIYEFDVILRKQQ